VEKTIVGKAAAGMANREIVKPAVAQNSLLQRILQRIYRF
jgi:hypothetical protein